MCSGIRIICQDGTVLVSRTLEFGLVMDYKIYISRDIIGVKVGDYFVDGINKYGLAAMAFYFPDYNEYSASPLIDRVNLASYEVANYILKNAKNIEDVKSIAQNITVLNTIYEPQGIVLPLHWFCVDKTGKSVVIECVKGDAKVYDNELGIMTNSPTYPEHLLTLQNYPKFSQENDPQKTYSQGTGMIGLPGDFTSISRFVRLNVFQKFHDKPKNKNDGINTSFHILNNFDIVKGYIVDKNNVEFTQYTIVYNLTDFDGWFKTYEDQQIKNLRTNKNLVMYKSNKYKKIYLLLAIIFLIIFFIFL